METIKKQVSYTTINHIARKELGLTWLEYGLADLVYNLSNNPKSDYPTWCYASKQFLATNLGVTKQSIHSLINKLINKNLLERHPETKHLKITIDWYNTVIIKGGKDALPVVNEVDPSSKESLPQGSKETLHNKDIANKELNTAEKEINKEKENSLVKKKTDTPSKYSQIQDLTEIDFEEIAAEYKVPLGLVKFQFEKLKNYTPNRSKKPYRDFKAALRNFVLTAMEKTIERSSPDPSKRAVDARNL